MTAARPRPEQGRTKAVNLRIREETRALIDRAATAQGKSRSEFMIDAARRAAEETLLDRAVFNADREIYEAFRVQLDQAPASNERLRRTLRQSPPWERT